MFTPTRNFATPTPNKSGGVGVSRTSTTGAVSKGKAVAFADRPPPPLGSLGNGFDGVDRDGDEDPQVWQKFKDDGSLDESIMIKRDRQALQERVTKLENELYDYQYNMGLLLIEKKEWTSKFEEIQQALAEEREIIKRERTANLFNASEVEKREENLRKALGVEKQCVIDLEKALREMRTESAEIKYAADTKMAEANALIANYEEKSLDVEAKLHAADAKLAEANRKCSEIDRKLKEIEARESSVRSERHSFNAERGMHEETLSKEREELRDWERTLQAREEKLIESRRIINQREETANEKDMTINQKEKDLEELQKKLENISATLRKTEEDINKRSANLSAREKDVVALEQKLEMKRNELLALEEKLSERERVEIQKLVDEHNAILESKKDEFELEMERKRKSADEELKSKEEGVNQMEIEISHREEKINKREQALDKKIEKFKEKEKDHDSKMKSLREWEKRLKAEEKDIGMKKKQIEADEENMQSLFVELETKKADLEEKQSYLHAEGEKLKITEEERMEHSRLKSELTEQIEKYKHKAELLSKEHENLKQDRENFEKEWEVLDEKRAEITKELSRLSEEKECFEKMKHSVEESLKNEKLATQDYVQRELEGLKLQKESFEAMMEHERSVASEKARTQREDMLREIRLRESVLDTDMQNKRDEMERQLREREREFEEQRDRDLKNIKDLREEAEREMEDAKVEMVKLMNVKQKIASDKQLLELQQLDMRKDIDKLDNLIKNLRNQKAQFRKLVEKYKSCKNCGEITSDFILSDLRSLEEMEDFEALSLPKRAEHYLESIQGNPTSVRLNRSPLETGSGIAASGRSMSFIRRCASKIINMSPHAKSTVDVPQASADNSPQLIETPNAEAVEEARCSENALEPAHGIQSETVQTVNSVRDVQVEPSHGIQSETVQTRNSGRDVQVEPTQHTHSFDELSSRDRVTVVNAEDSEHSELKLGRAKTGKKRIPGVRRTRSVKAVVEESKAILGSSQEQKDDRLENGNPEDLIDANEGSRDDSSFADKRNGTAGRKRNHTNVSTSEATGQEVDGHDSRSESVTAGGRRRKRQQTAPGLQTPSRYNFRQRKPKGAAATTQPSSDLAKGKEKEDAPANVVEEESTDLTQGTTVKMITSTQQFTSENRILMFNTVEENDGSNADATKSNEKNESSEEVNEKEGTSDYVDEEGFQSEIGVVGDGDGDGDGYGEVDEDEDGEDEDEESQHPGQASISKKLWNFFTS